ncbi:MAG: hypothetical protein JNL80_04240 [Phycisphaerae bacterium]|jgi:hypothetical protein|nr:hypothetical protein [Phycisphaerae bacterium]
MITPGSAQQSLRDHVLRKALDARARHGTPRDRAAVERIVADRDVIRYPLTIGIDADGLDAGEFAWLEPLGALPSDGHRLHVHPLLGPMDELLPLVIAYYIPSVNYGDIVGPEEAEAFGATLCGMAVEDYYATLCAIADRLIGRGSR